MPRLREFRGVSRLVGGCRGDPLAKKGFRWQKKGRRGHNLTVCVGRDGGRTKPPVALAIAGCVRCRADVEVKRERGTGRACEGNADGCRRPGGGRGDGGIVGEVIRTGRSDGVVVGSNAVSTQIDSQTAGICSNRVETDCVPGRGVAIDTCCRSVPS